MAQPSDDGRIRTAVVGSGILAVPWSMAQLGWILGPATLVVFAIITYHAATLLIDCYRVGDPNRGRRNYTYMDAVRSFLGERKEFWCGLFQYSILCGTMVGYTITTAASIVAVIRSICFHEKGRGADCNTSGTLYMILYGGMQIILSQFPNLEKVALLSATAAITSVGYCLTALGLTTAKLAMNHTVRGSLKLGMASEEISSMNKVWNVFQALGNIAFAYTYSMVLLEIQDTLRVPPENKTMRKVTKWALGGTTLFYITLGCTGYAAFGNDVPGNVLTGDYNPFWIVDIGNIAVIIHLITAYQVFAQPIYGAFERWLASKYPTTPFFNKTYTLRPPFTKTLNIEFTLSRLVLRTILVMFTTALALIIPFFNAILGLLGAISFWPLTIYLPVQMYMVQAEIKRGCPTWMMFKAMSFCCLLVTLMAAIGSTASIVEQLKVAKLFDKQQIQQPETLVLRLNRKKKKVTWKEGTIDNEFMNKKSSKRCCIFHKEKPFDEDDSDDEDRPNSDKPHGDGCCSHGHGDGRSGNGVAD
ncbi:hypothetical protein Cgig2_017349 [Carnegiea gigantea]|uniref:Amino acid transporter transmembrane domain-containing protein n=1 Tax=Carnegiea gigantea TaxID=171969 RepID=A0A9Q1K4Y4_9CARY|nr:hypothetical protein Cgig2_017349 [Carnegiea gigantea]